MHACFVNAAFGRCPAMYGRKLHPLTLGHCLILDHLDNVALYLPKPSNNALVVAAWICSQPWHEAQSKIMRGIYAHDIQVWGHLARKTKYGTELKKWRQYRETYFRFPDRWIDEKETKSRSKCAPWQYRIAAALMKLGISEERTWNMALPLAFSYFVADCENNGDNDFVNDSERRAGA